MSCQMKKIAYLTNISEIREILFGYLFATSDISEDELPIQDCFISLSSAGDVLAMARNKTLIILISKLDLLEPGETRNKFHMIWHDEISAKSWERITSVICLPLLSSTQTSSDSSSDLTCIIVGFNTGFIKFYTETGTLLLVEKLHNEPVLGLKFQSLRSPKYVGDISLSEEVHIVYSSVVCILDGTSLVSALRTSTIYLSTARADCYDIPPTEALLYKKWSYETQDIVNDLEVIGTTSVNYFDYLVTASLCSGHTASYRSSPPQQNLIIATGKEPFIGFYYALKGGLVPVLADVALAVTNKLANAIGNAVPWHPNHRNSKWKKNAESSKISACEPAELMICRFGLCDLKREGLSIISSPNKALSVVSDAMGRVLLIDNRCGLAMRMWKGYRDAQCGWIEAEGEKHCRMQKSSSSQLCSVLFLVVYAPKKGVIDIWSTQQGPKITTFTASKHGRLLYINYGFLGVNNDVHLSRNKPQYSCIFMDPHGGLKEITVPFYIALNSESRKKARDVHLLKKLKSFLQEEAYDYKRLISEMENVFSDFRTDEIKVRVIEMLMTNKNVLPDFLLTATKCFVKKLDECGTEQMKPTTKALYLLTTQVQQVIRFYRHIEIQLRTSADNSISLNDNDNELSSASLSSILLTSEEEVRRIFDLFDKVNQYKCSNPKTECKVKFEESRNTFADFLSCFAFGTPGLIDIKKDMSIERKHHISQIMYEGCIYSFDGFTTWKEAAMASNIQPIVFMEFALIYWLNKKEHGCLEVELKQYTQLFRTICSLANVEDMCPDYNEISLWWKKVRSILSESTNSLNALCAALMCRAVAMSVEKCKESRYSKVEDNNDHRRIDSKNVYNVPEAKEQLDYIATVKPDDEVYNLTNEWENLTNDSCLFTLLVGNLEDITILDAIVSQQPPSDISTQFFALPFVKFDISLGFILSKGKGSVSEIVAKWIASSGIDPAQLVDTTDAEFDNVQLTTECLDTLNFTDKKSNTNDVLHCDLKNSLSLLAEETSEGKNGTNASSCILERLKLLKLHFPYSLTSSVLLANICWEFVTSWNEDISQLEPFAAALSVLRYIPMQHMKNGICCLLWSTYLKKRMEAVAKLINKLGKLPKERLCIQEVGMSDIQTVAFLRNCVTFFEIFISVNLSEVIETGANVAIKSEELWEGFTSDSKPFVALAIAQAPACYDLIILHVQLANVLYMMAHFNIRIHKPLYTLFGPMVQPYFFQTISDRVVLPLCQYDKRDRLRATFLRRVITASMDFVYRDTTNDKVISLNQAIEWMSRCQTLASIWKINNDELRIHQVRQLYVNGLDRLAEEVISAVNDVERLAADLLPIAGKRLMAYVSKKPDLLEDFSRISPALTRYLETLDVTEVSCTCCSNDDTTELLRRVSRHLSETHPLHYIVPLMLDAAYICE